ncbi:HAD family phosphatase [Opitutus sp. ER46]|uniref:HAD family hydrolase n=1 Tax=Opitutus sp. ER46 TaxID=2161864 RepID=UPI001304CEE9|nr:HAD family phosphatase [Opitutus sp. ER46]
MIRALIFDFDGLMLDTEGPLIESYAAVHAMHGVPFDLPRFMKGVGHAEYAFDPWHGFSPHADRVQLEVERRAKRDEGLARQQVLPGVVAMLDAARERGLQVGIASNSQHSWVEPHLQRLGLHDRFAFFACREDAVSPKPEPDLYRLVLNRFGLRGPEAIAFEDSETGVRAAKRANLWTVAIPTKHTAHHDLAPADLRVNSMADVTLEALIARFGT